MTILNIFMKSAVVMNHTEDLYVPGFFEMPIKKGESIILYAGTEEINPVIINRISIKSFPNRLPVIPMRTAFINAAGQFFYKYEGGTDIIAGYPWYDRIGRFTFISLPWTFNGQMVKNFAMKLLIQWFRK
jgi:hypothetical protein